MSDDEHLSPELGDEAAFEDWNHPDPSELWPMDDEHLVDIHLPPVVDDLREGETLEERNERLLAQQGRDRQEDRPEGTRSDPFIDELVKGDFPTDDIRWSAVKVIDADGNESWRDIGRDLAALRAFIEAHAAERGFTLEELRRRFPAGRPRPRDRVRRRVLAEILNAAKEAGAKPGALQEVLRLDRRRVSELLGFD